MNISPLEIDTVLIKHPKVVEAGAFGIPHSIYGEEVVACVAGNPGEPISTDALLVHCAEHLPEEKIPKTIYFLDELPKNTRGKLDRFALQELFSSWTFFDHIQVGPALEKCASSTPIRQGLF